MNRKTGIIVGFYIPGVYPPGRDDVQVNLLAPAFLKSSADADLDISREYDLEIISVSIKAGQRALARKISEKSPFFVSYSVYLWNYNETVESSGLVKMLSPSVKILYGGPQVSFLREETMEEVPHVDVIIAGSGEERFKDLLKCDFDIKKLAEMPNVAYREEGDNRIVLTEGYVKEDVSKIPSPFTAKAINLDDGNKHTVMIETFRGCPMQCAYCQWGSPDGSTYRFPIDQILQDIEIIYNNPNVEYVYLTDANLFYTPKKHWKTIIDKIASCSRRIPTVASLDIRVLNEEMIKALSKIELALNQYQFGMQSTNPNALDLANRKCSNETWEAGISLIRSIDPESQISLEVIYGLPGDNYEGFLNTVDFALGLSPNKFYMFPLLVLPGTPFWDRRDEFEFEMTEKPEYMVISNKEYSLEDMRRTFEFATWFQAMQRFPAIQRALLSSANGRRKVDVIQQYISQLQKRTGLGAEVDFDFTLRSSNRILREIMDNVFRPENSFKAYEITSEIVSGNGNGISKDIQLGLDYYDARKKESVGEVDNCFIEEFGKEKLSRIKCNWFVSHNNIG